jgi:hypothetical protein
MHLLRMNLNFLPRCHGLRSFESECFNTYGINRRNTSHCKMIQFATCHASSSSGQQPGQAEGSPTTLPLKASKVSELDVSVTDVLPPPPDLNGKKPQRSWNATALAFLGDGVWEVCYPSTIVLWLWHHQELLIMNRVANWNVL